MEPWWGFYSDPWHMAFRLTDDVSRPMDAQEFSKYGHVFRPGLFRRRRAFWLNGDILHWRKGRVKGHVALSQITDVVVRKQFGGATCRLVEANRRTHHISERHWFGWEVGERHRFGASELRSVTFVSLVSAIRWRMKKERPAPAPRS